VREVPAAVMADTVDKLARFKEFGPVADRATPDVLAELTRMSPATIDRYLAPHKKALYPEAVAATRPGHLLRQSIPVHACYDGTIDDIGFLELDTVAHCGFELKGEFLWTLTATDPVIGWTVLRTIKNKAFVHVSAGLDWVARELPYPVIGVDFDNGSKFLNWGVVAWADARDLPLTRGRPYAKNDNAHVEQRNGDWVRKHCSRFRYETDEAMRLLNELWQQVMLRKHFLLPCVKAVGWTETPSGRKKQIYDQPATP